MNKSPMEIRPKLSPMDTRYKGNVTHKSEVTYQREPDVDPSPQEGIATEVLTAEYPLEPPHDEQVSHEDVKVDEENHSRQDSKTLTAEYPLDPTLEEQVFHKDENVDEKKHSKKERKEQFRSDSEVKPKTSKPRREKKVSKKKQE